jgi:hypothetical protein
MLNRSRILALAATEDLPPISAEQAEQVVCLMTESPYVACVAQDAAMGVASRSVAS